MQSHLEKMNEKLIEDLQQSIPDSIELDIDIFRHVNVSQETLSQILIWEESLRKKLETATENLRVQRAAETRCRLLEERVSELSMDMSNPQEFKVDKPKIRSLSDFDSWEDKLSQTLVEIEIKAERDAVYLGKQANKKLKLSNVNLSMKEPSRISDIQYARRMDKLDKLAKCISQIEDEQTRESFVFETNPLLDMERDDEFDDMIIEINTRVRSIKKVERRRAEAMEEAEKIAHIKSPDAPDIIAAAAKVSTQAELSDVKKRVAELLQAEQREANDRHVRRAIRETLKEMGYEVGEGFVQTEYGPVVIASKESEPEHALRVQLSPTDPKNPTVSSMYTRIVSTGNTTPEQDMHAEERMCPDCRGMAEGLREWGIEVELVRESKPGDYPLDKVGRDIRDDAEAARQAQQARRRRRGNTAARRRNA